MKKTIIICVLSLMLTSLSRAETRLEWDHDSVGSDMENLTVTDNGGETLSESEGSALQSNEYFALYESSGEELKTSGGFGLNADYIGDGDVDGYYVYYSEFDPTYYLATSTGDYLRASDGERIRCLSGNDGTAYQNWTKHTIPNSLQQYCLLSALDLDLENCSYSFTCTAYNEANESDTSNYIFHAMFARGSIWIGSGKDHTVGTGGATLRIGE